MRGKWVRTIVYSILISLLWTCTSCAGKPSREQQQAIVKAMYIERLMMGAKRAGCNGFTIDHEQYHEVENTHVDCGEKK